MLLIRSLLLSMLTAIFASGCSQQSCDSEVSRIAFGSCAGQDKEQPIWEAINEAEPQVWVWLGDNIYGDSEIEAEIVAKYELQKAKPGYANLRASCQIIGTWDDHDFGVNNGGKEFPAKKMTQKALLDFLDTPEDSPRRKQEGVYWSHEYGAGENKLKVILLDCRYHRDSPSDPNGDILGDAQWKWLESQLKDSEASLHIIASGIQVLPEDHRYEKWMQFPKARARLFDLIKSTGAKGVIFISGDRHIAEISKHQTEGLDYPLFDVTSSSMTHSWYDFPGEPNRHRVGEVFHRDNFGFIEVDWEKRVAIATIRDEAGIVHRSAEISFE